ncbi:MAG: TonB-dependent receptor [Bacteroidales bacterium]|nr:TonB-dependent receptor [Bacteroidales bacterium]
MNMKKLSITLLSLILAFADVFAATGPVVSGVVKDAAGEPLIGVGVVLKGTVNGTVTDIDGAFSLEVPSDAVLTFSFIGFVSKDVPVEGRSVLNVTLEEDTQRLEEVVVVGYGSMKKRDLVGAVDAVGSEVIGNRANSNLARSLQGEVAGLNITITDSKPSHGGSYNVRGASSIGAGGSSLVLIDGVEGNLSMVNPQDVESVSVLKDASSTAVYGARGAFGVILVTTKQAGKGNPIVNYSGSYSINRRTVIPDAITDSQQWLDWWIACYNGYYNGSKALLDNIDNKAPYSQAIYDEIVRRKSDPTLGKVEESYDVPGFGWAYYDNHDWFKEFYRDFHSSTEHNISVSGGGNIADYYVSGRFYDSQGVFRVGNENYKKYNLRAKGTLKIRPWLKLTNNASLSIDNNYVPRSQTGQSVQRFMQHALAPMVPLRNPDGTWTPAAAESGYAAMYEGNNYIKDDYLYLRDKLDLDIDIVPEVLKLQADYSYNYTGRKRHIVQNPVTYSKSPGEILVSSVTPAAYLRLTDYDTRYQAVNAYATYTPKLGEDHRLSVLAGYNQEWCNYSTTTSNRLDFISEKPSFSLMDGEASITSGGYEWAYVGFFARVNYSWKGRYLIEASGRYDGSSKFPTQSRWGFFPSASLGWRVSEEPWMAWSRSVLDNFKLRASAGAMGNGNVSPYKYTSEMTVTKADDIVIAGTLPSYTSVASLVPLSLTWEKAATYDVGLDLDLFRNRLSASFDYYVRITSDMYTDGASLPPVFGGSVPKGNNAEMRTNGWELSIQWKDQFQLLGSPFSYSVKGTLWDSMSTITKYLGNDQRSLGTVAHLVDNMGQPEYYVGMQLGEMWGYTVTGLFKDWQDVYNSATQNYKQASDLVTRPGQVKFADLDDNGTIDYNNLTLNDHGDLSIIGNSTPRYRFGINLSASWYGVGLSIFLQGVGKRDWYPGKDCGYFWGKYSRPFFYFIPSIHAQNNPTVAQMSEDGSECLNYDTAYWPRLTTYIANNSNDKQTIMNMPNTRYMQNAAYLRVKNIQLDYSFPEHICKAIRMRALKVYVNAENLFTFTPLHKWAPNLDPEGIDGGDSDFSASGLNGNSYPIFKTITIGVNITF